MLTHRLAPGPGIPFSHCQRSTGEGGPDAYGPVCPRRLLSSVQRVTYVSQATVRLGHESRRSPGAASAHTVQDLDRRERVMAVLDCSNSEFEGGVWHGKIPLFSRGALFTSANVEAPGLVLTLSNIAARGV